MIELDRNKLVIMLNRKWKGIGCPYCNQSQWSIEHDLATTVGVSNEGGIMIGGGVYPFVLVTCNNCGHTVFVNAKVLDCIGETNEKESKVN
ncbi:MAG: hypothetical protein HFE52_07830 [Clostridia bacterium]|nr:hypothetical protein [Clostridia bacterium]